MSRSNEAFWWSLFSAGGVLAALFLPAIVVATGFLLPTEDAVAATDRYRQLRSLVGWWPVRIVFFVVLFLSFFHCAHRIRHTLMDLGLRRFEHVLKAVCYLSAAAGVFAAAVVLGKM